MTTKKLVAIATAFSLAVGGTSYITPASNTATTLKLKNVSKKKTSKKVILLTVKKKATSSTTKPKSTNTPRPTANNVEWPSWQHWAPFRPGASK